MDCPCCSEKQYEACCKRYHEGMLPATPVALMRSRYSAYALAKADYIIETTHPDSPYFEQDREKWRRAILHFCNTTRFLKLEILNSEADWVHFAATLEQRERFILDEKSSFATIEGKWLYLKGEYRKR